MNKTEPCSLEAPRLVAKKESENVSVLESLGILDRNSEKTRAVLSHGFLKSIPSGSPWTLMGSHSKKLALTDISMCLTDHIFSFSIPVMPHPRS